MPRSVRSPFLARLEGAAILIGAVWHYVGLGAPIGTVLARLHRGRKLFERELWDYAETNGLLVEPVR